MTRTRLVPALAVALIAAACDVSTTAPQALSRVERRGLVSDAEGAYDRGEFAACAPLYEQVPDPYAAARCHARAGALDAAFTALERAIGGRFHDTLPLERDSDLEPLRGDPRWPQVRARFDAALEAYRASINAELLELYTQDQADREGGTDIDWERLPPRDRARRARVDAILAAGGARAADDYYHAAMVYQHGQMPSEIERARTLALQAVELDPEHHAARWLTAAATDRKLMFEGKPQKYGTQFQQVTGVWELWTVDPATTDAERAEWNVRPRAEAEAIAARLNAPAS